MMWFINILRDNIISFILGGLLNAIVGNYKHILLWIRSILNYNKEIRISYSYIFRIKIDNKYLLIKGNRIDQYQPVGGVYKYYDSFKDKYQKWEIVSEKNSDFFEEKDLRIFIKGRYVMDFLKWIESNQNRECDYKREFIEELINPKYLDLSVVDDIEFEFIRRVNNGIHYSQHFKCKEILIYDVVVLNNLSKNIQDHLITIASSNKNLVFVTADDIERECVQVDGKSTKIGKHAKIIK